MEGGFEWPCRYCGGRFADLSAHFPECSAKRWAAAAEDLRRLGELEAASVEVLPSAPLALIGSDPPAKPKGNGGRPRKHADRLAYKREYMRAYMRARRK